MQLMSNGKVRRSDAEWREILARWKKSGLSPEGVLQERGSAAHELSAVAGAARRQPHRERIRTRDAGTAGSEGDVPVDARSHPPQRRPASFPGLMRGSGARGLEDPCLSPARRHEEVLRRARGVGEERAGRGPTLGNALCFRQSPRDIRQGGLLGPDGILLVREASGARSIRVSESRRELRDERTSISFAARWNRAWQKQAVVVEEEHDV